MGFPTAKSKESTEELSGAAGGTFQAGEGVDAQRAPERQLRGAISRNPGEASTTRAQDRRQSKIKTGQKQTDLTQGVVLPCGRISTFFFGVEERRSVLGSAGIRRHKTGLTEPETSLA